MSMSENPVISSVLSVPTLAENGRPQLTVGIQLTTGQRFWADCIDAPAASRQGEAAVFDPIQGMEHVKNLVCPLWEGQPAAAFRPLAQLLMPIIETFAYTKNVPPQPIAGTVSRRKLITGFLAESTPQTSRYEKVSVERPLHPALQYGLTAALLPAVAAANRVSVAELVAREYTLALSNTAVPLQIQLNDQAIQAAQSILTSHVASLGYTTSKNNHKANLGPNGERLQQYVRQIASWLPTLDRAYQPTLNLDLQGSYGPLFENNTGKILGALFGLEHAAKPFQLLIQNPVWLESRNEQIQQLEQLAKLVKMRRLRLQLVADAWVDSPTDVELFVNPQVCQMAHLELPRLGNLEAGMTAVLHCKAQNQPLILSGANNPLTAQIALALHPDLLHGSPTIFYSEMQKHLAK